MRVSLTGPLWLIAWTAIGLSACGDAQDGGLDDDAVAATDSLDAATDTFAPQTDVVGADTDSFDAGSDSAGADTDTFEAGSDAVDAQTDASDTGSDVVDAQTDVVDAGSDVVDAYTDTFEVGSDLVDAVTDTVDTADSPDTGLDPSCPYNPKQICLHWGVCKTGDVKVDCSSGEPECDYSNVAGYEIVEKSCDGLDNDCNNLIDDDLKVPAASKTEGACWGLVKTCQGANGWQDPNFLMVPYFQPIETACDGIDNDCDGAIDVFATPKKISGMNGVCGDGDYYCAGSNGWQMPPLNSLPFWEPVETMCDGLDNDCDGLTDEDMDTPNFLGSGVKINNAGVCNGAWIRCLDGVWSAPDYSKQPGWEAVESSCDGLDNDCNGLVDEMAPALASMQAGVCAGQKVVCSGKIGWQDPDWSQVPGYATDAEWQCDGLDNNCNGLTDEDAACPMWQVGGRGRGKVALSPDGAHLAWTTMQGAQVLDWQTRTVQRNWFGHGHAVTAVAFSADGTQLATGGQVDVLQVWPLAESPTPAVALTPKLKVSGLGTTFAAVAFSPNGGQVAVGDATGTVRIYAMWSGLQIAALIGHKAQVGAIAWLPDTAGDTNAGGGGGVLLTGDDAGTVWRWLPALMVGDPLAVMQGAVRAIAVLPGTSETLLVADNQAIVVDAQSGAPLVQLQAGQQPWAGGALRPDQGGEALLLAADGTVQRFALPAPSDALVDVTPTQLFAPPDELAGDTATSLAAAEGHVAVGFVASGPWQLDVASGAWIPATPRHLGAVQDAAVSGGLLLTGGDDAMLRLWRADDGAALLNLPGHTGTVLTILPLAQLPQAPPGSDLAALLGAGLGLATGSADYTVRLWTLKSTPGGITVLTPKIFGLGGPWPTDLALTADVPGIWTAGGPTLGKYATDASKPGQKLNAYPTKLGNVIERVAASPDGQWLALGMSGDGPSFNIHYRIINAKTFAVLREWSGMPANVHALAWSGDGERIALAGADGVIQIAQVQSGAVEQQLFGHTAAITALDWSPAGRLLSTSLDGTARAWNAIPNQGVVPSAIFSRHCPAPCANSSGGQIGVLGGVWQDAQAKRAITFASDGSLFAWKAPASP